jgi:hypothetical protein
MRLIFAWLSEGDSRAQRADVVGQDRGLGKPALREQRPRPARVGAVGLGAAPSPPQRASRRPGRGGGLRRRARAPGRRSTSRCTSRARHGPHGPQSTRPLRRPPRLATILPVVTSRVSVSSASKEIWARWMPKPATTMPGRTSSSSARAQSRSLSGRRSLGSCHLWDATPGCFDVKAFGVRDQGRRLCLARLHRRRRRRESITNRRAHARWRGRRPARQLDPRQRDHAGGLSPEATP